MSDFASAAMVNVVLNGMALLGMDTRAVRHLANPEAAHIPLQAKQTLVAATLAQGGWPSLLQLGQGFHTLGDAPLHRALASAPDAATLLERWCRLEKYVHSRHRVRCLQVDPQQASLQHVSLTPNTAPTAAEDLVVLGLLCALLQALGLQEVRAQIQGVEVFPRAEASALATLAAQGNTAHWTLHWTQALTPDPQWPAHETTAQRPMPQDLCKSLPWPALAQRCAQTLLGDLMQIHTVASMATHLGLSARSLQRHLHAQGLQFSHIIAETRLRAAAWWLLETPLSLAETGFVCGYADQAHFNRCYKRQTGLTPGAYRSSFGAAPSAAA